MVTRKANIVSRISPAETLKNLKIEEPVVIPTSKIKASVVRSTASRLSEKGYSFIISEAGLTNAILVTRKS